MEWLIEADRQLLLQINGWNCGFFDVFMWLASSTVIWIPFFTAFLFLVIKNKKKEAFLVILMVALTILLADQISSSLIKPLVARFRPTHSPVLENLVHVVNDYRGGRYGFVSSHAANTFGFALFSSLLVHYCPYTFAAFLWASLSSYSRMYLGVHYPLDILGGIFVGLASAGVFYSFYVFLQARIFSRSLSDRIYYSKEVFTTTGFDKKTIQMVIWTLLLTVVFMSLVCLRIKSI